MFSFISKVATSLATPLSIVLTFVLNVILFPISVLYSMISKDKVGKYRIGPVGAIGYIGYDRKTDRLLFRTLTGSRPIAVYIEPGVPVILAALLFLVCSPILSILVMFKPDAPKLKQCDKCLNIQK